MHVLKFLKKKKIAEKTFFVNKISEFNKLNTYVKFYPVIVTY